MRTLILERLRYLKMRIFWKEYAPAHFGGHTGTYIWFIPGFLPPDPKCEPASVGETWYDPEPMHLREGSVGMRVT